jgi:carboxypeptidase C (cathepsin A)
VPVLLWLQGGPGASSQFGAFTEVGPIRIRNGTARLFYSGWNFVGHIIFVDSPLNVGFSFQGTDRLGPNQVNSTNQATDHLVNFLVNFYDTWPELA